MKLSFVFLCLSLATLSLAAIPPPAKNSSLSRRKHRRPRLVSDKQAKKKSARNGEKMPKKHSRVGATNGLEKPSADAGKDSRKASTANNGGKYALNFPKVLVELIGAYLEGSYSVVFTRDWSAAQCWSKVAVDSEQHYLIAKQGIQASSHGDGEQVSLGSPDLSDYSGFQSSHDGRSLFFIGKTKEQVSSGSVEKTARWLVQDTGTKSLKGVTLESGEISYVGSEFMLSTNGKTLLSASLKTWTTSVYQIEEHGKAASASKKADFDGYIVAVSGNGNRILMEYTEKEQLEIYDISRDRSNLVLEINYAGTTDVGTCALNNDGSKAAFIVYSCKLYIVDANKENVSVDQLTAIDIPGSFLVHSLTYDANDRLYVFGGGNLWLVDPSERKLVSLEKAQAPQGYEFRGSAISPNGNYIALLFLSTKKSVVGEYQYRIVVKRDAKDPFMRLCGYKS